MLVCVQYALQVVELVQRNNIIHASERQQGKNVVPGND